MTTVHSKYINIHFYYSHMQSNEGVIVIYYILMKMAVDSSGWVLGKAFAPAHVTRRS